MANTKECHGIFVDFLVSYCFVWIFHVLWIFCLFILVLVFMRVSFFIFLSFLKREKWERPGFGWLRMRRLGGIREREKHDPNTQ